MSAKANYFRLGLFVIVAVALLCAGVIVLGAGKLFEKKVIVETYMDESVEGISPGSAVKFRGIQLGEVASMSLTVSRYDQEGFKEGRFGSSVLLELAIDRKEAPPLDDAQLANWLARAVAGGLRARTASSGLTGPAYVELVYLDPKEFPAPQLAWTPPPLYVPSAPSQTQVLLGAVQRILRKVEAIDVQQLAENADAVLKSAHARLDELDMKDLSDNAVALVQEVRKSNDRLQAILNNPSIDPSLEDLRATLENAKKASARIEEILSDPRVDRFMTNADRVGEDLPPGIQDMRRALRRIDRLIQAEQATIESSLADLNQALQNIKNITGDAQQNPARILFGDPPPHLTPGAKR